MESETKIYLFIGVTNDFEKSSIIDCVYWNLDYHPIEVYLDDRHHLQQSLDYVQQVLVEIVPMYQ